MQLVWLLSGVVIVIVIVIIINIGRWFLSKKTNIWPEVVLALILFFLGWSVLKQPSIPVYVKIVLTGSPTPTRTPNATSTLPSESVYLKIPVEKFAQLESFSTIPNVEMVRMIMIAKENVTTASGSTVVSHKAEAMCVSRPAFLDGAENANPYHKEETKNVLIIVKTEDLPFLGEVMADVEQIYFAPDSTCSSSSAGTSTSAPSQATLTPSLLSPAPTGTLSITSTPQTPPTTGTQADG